LSHSSTSNALALPCSSVRTATAPRRSSAIIAVDRSTLQRMAVVSPTALRRYQPACPTAPDSDREPRSAPAADRGLHQLLPVRLPPCLRHRPCPPHHSDPSHHPDPPVDRRANSKPCGAARFPS